MSNEALDEAMQGNPLWELHRRRMLEVDSALGDWRFEDLRNETRDLLIDSIESRTPASALHVVNIEVPDTDAKALHLKEKDKSSDAIEPIVQKSTEPLGTPESR